MADVYSTTVGSTTVGANARRAVVYYPNASATAASPYSQFGTRQLTLLKATAGGGTPFTAASLDDADSAFQKSIQALQNFGELFYITRISDTVIGFAYAEETRNGAEANSNVQADTYGALEAQLGTATGQTVTVAASTLS